MWRLLKDCLLLIEVLYLIIVGLHRTLKDFQLFCYLVILYFSTGKYTNDCFFPTDLVEVLRHSVDKGSVLLIQHIFKSN